MDGTLLPKTSALVEIAKLRGDVEKLILLERHYFEQKINNLQFAEELFLIWQDLTEEMVEQAFLVTPKLENIEKTLAKIKENNHLSCLITAAPEFYARHFKSFGFDYIFASNPFDLKEKIFKSHEVLKGSDKPLIAHKLCQELSIDFEESVAFGDSISDKPLFEALKHTVSINGDKHIKDFARHHYCGNNLLEAFQLVN